MIAINYLKCSCCEGSGIIAEETTGNYEPFAQNFIELECDCCNGQGQIVDLDEMIARTDDKYGVVYENELGFIAEADELLSGLQRRKEMILYSLVTIQKMNLETSLKNKYIDRLDTINRGIDRVKNYRQILLTHETNI